MNATTRRRRRIGRGRPELVELREKLEALGVEDGGAVHVVEALALGAERYVRALAEDGNAWTRFREAFDSLRAGFGHVSPDEITVGALTWVVIDGNTFTNAIHEAIGYRESLH